MRNEDDKLLITIQNVGTIRGAAKELLISQPAISKRLMQLEEYWGEQIFIRTHKRVIITPAGEKILGLAKKRIQDQKLLRDEISTLSNKVSGRLSLGVSSVVAQYILPSLLEKYIRQFPEVKIEMLTGLSQDIRSSLLDFHVSIIRGDNVKDQFSEKIFSDPLYLIDKKINVTRSSYENRSLIEFQSDTSFHSMVNEWFIHHPEFKPAQKIKVDQIATCKQFMIHGIGMAVLPETAIQDLDENLYSFQPLTDENEALTRNTWISYSKTSLQLPQVKAFVQLLSEFETN